MGSDQAESLRRLRENQARPESDRLPSAVVVREATLEIRSSIVFATVVIVLVFLPMFFLAGIEGRLLTPLAFAYVVALMASLAVAVAVTPALCVVFLPGARSVGRGHDGVLTRALKAAYARTLPPILDHPAVVIATAVVLLVSAGAAMTRAPFPQLKRFRRDAHAADATCWCHTSAGCWSLA